MFVLLIFGEYLTTCKINKNMKHPNKNNIDITELVRSLYWGNITGNINEVDKLAKTIDTSIPKYGRFKLREWTRCLL